MDFGYNDLVWIVSVIVWTTGVTAIIMYIIKKEELHGLLKVNTVMFFPEDSSIAFCMITRILFIH